MKKPQPLDRGDVATPYEDQEGDDLVLWYRDVFDWLLEHPEDRDEYEPALTETKTMISERIAKSKEITSHVQ